MRVLYREVKLTGMPGKIERSADALQIDEIWSTENSILSFPSGSQDPGTILIGGYHVWNCGLYRRKGRHSAHFGWAEEAGIPGV